MKREKWIAEALSAWLDEALRTESDVASVGLPPMDVRHFLACLAKAKGFRAEDFSLALAGFGVDETGLRVLVNKAGLRQLAHVAVDLNTAAAWRNAHQQHPRIIALARGRHPGVHTLRHFAPARSRELARAILRRAAQDETFTKGNSRHRELLERLAEARELEPLCSLESVADFLAAWENHTVTSAEEAPLRALPVLGLLADDQLFEKAQNLELRLERNLDLTGKVLDVRRHQLAAMRERFAKRKDRASDSVSWICSTVSRCSSESRHRKLARPLHWARQRRSSRRRKKSCRNRRILRRMTNLSPPMRRMMPTMAKAS